MFQTSSPNIHVKFNVYSIDKAQSALGCRSLKEVQTYSVNTLADLKSKIRDDEGSPTSAPNSVVGFAGVPQVFFEKWWWAKENTPLPFLRVELTDMSELRTLEELGIAEDESSIYVEEVDYKNAAASLDRSAERRAIPMLTLLIKHIEEQDRRAAAQRAMNERLMEGQVIFIEKLKEMSAVHQQQADAIILMQRAIRQLQEVARGPGIHSVALPVLPLRYLNDANYPANTEAITGLDREALLARWLNTPFKFPAMIGPRCIVMPDEGMWYETVDGALSKLVMGPLSECPSPTVHQIAHSLQVAMGASKIAVVDVQSSYLFDGRSPYLASDVVRLGKDNGIVVVIDVDLLARRDQTKSVSDHERSDTPVMSIVDQVASLANSVSTLIRNIRGSSSDITSRHHQQGFGTAVEAIASSGKSTYSPSSLDYQGGDMEWQDTNDDVGFQAEDVEEEEEEKKDDRVPTEEREGSASCFSIIVCVTRNQLIRDRLKKAMGFGALETEASLSPAKATPQYSLGYLPRTTSAATKADDRLPVQVTRHTEGIEQEVTFGNATFGWGQRCEIEIRLSTIVNGGSTIGFITSDRSLSLEINVAEMRFWDGRSYADMRVQLPETEFDQLQDRRLARSTSYRLALILGLWDPLSNSECSVIQLSTQEGFVWRQPLFDLKHLTFHPHMNLKKKFDSALVENVTVNLSKLK